ncbi:hypothetical protein D3C87_1246140 [compost metagenome]
METFAHHHHYARWCLNQHFLVTATGLEQANTDLRIFTEARRHRTTTRAATHHHVIEHTLTHINLPQDFTSASGLPR